VTDIDPPVPIGVDADPAVFRLLADGAPIGMIHADHEGTVLWVNDRWRAITGCHHPVPISFDHLRLLMVDDDRRRVTKIQLTAAASVAEFSTDATVERHDGTKVRVRMQGAPVTTPSNELAGFVGTVQDITAERDAEDALRQRESRYRRLILDAPVPQAIAHVDGSLVEVNDAFCRLVGSDRAVVLARDPLTLFHPDDLPRLAREVRALLAGTVSSFDIERRFVREDGDVLWVTGGTSLLEDGGETFLHSVLQDITDRLEAEAALKAGEERYRRLLEHAPMGCIVTDQFGQILEANHAVGEIFSVPSTEVLGHTPWEWIHPDDAGRVSELVDGLLDGTLDRFEAEHRLVLAHGERRWVSIATTLIDGDARHERTYLVLLQDISDRKAAEEEQARLAHIVESTSDLVGLVDADTGHLLFLNDHARRVFGLRTREPSDLHFSELYEDSSVDVLSRQVLKVLLAGQTWTGEVAMCTAHGEVIQVWQTLTPSHDAAGRISTIAAVGRDVTERRRIEAELSYRALHDGLTGLANRTKLLERLEAALAHAASNDQQVALFFLDLDRFKQVNDTLGHDAGDELLGEVGRRVSVALRDGDLVARIGGDEFVLLCPGVQDEAEARELALRVTDAVESRPIVLGAAEVTITVSVGIALSSGAAHSEALLRDADAAMYRAKALGRARLEVFDEGMRQRAVRRTDLADELMRAVQDGEIEVHYQPCIDLRTGAVREVEALARWTHPELGPLSPAEFIPIAEDTGLIVGLGLQVLTSACRAADGWLRDLGPTAPLVHVNLSARQLATPNLAALVSGVLRSTGLDASRLCLEITESVLMEDAPTAVRAVEALKSIGVRVAIDDFGTGYSSLSYLRRFPVDVLKVDRSFVDGLGPDPEDSAIVAAIVNLAANLDLEAIAEGVETRQQLELLCQLGCGGAQGFFFSKAVPLPELTPLLRHTWPLPRSAHREATTS